jgi:hypothetical protein
MSNYTSKARSNYFRVKNADSFLAWAAIRDVEVHPGKEEGYYGIFPQAGLGEFPSTDASGDEEIDFPLELSGHLADGSIAILMEAGAQGENYIQGYALAIDSKGVRVTVSLYDIYELVKAKLSGEVTRAEG